ncbi:MAG: carbohydrate ABC transporter permease [Acidimicrobiia bacterium]|jgi:multiple sugar transport system permease protein
MGLGQLFTFPIEWIPDPFQWGNYGEALSTVPFFLYFRNTLVLVIIVVVGTVVTATLSAYSFARLDWPGRDIVFALVMSALLLPYAVTIVPTFLVWTKLDLVGTIAPLTVPSWFGGNAFFVFLLRQFFRSLPPDLDEAAVLDGANPLQILWHVIVPLSRPALVTVALFAGLAVWNDFLNPLIYLTDSDQFTLALGLAQFKGLFNTQWHLLMAASTMVVAPVLIVFLLTQRSFIEGISLAGVRR